jgi:hypothetical protein
MNGCFEMFFSNSQNQLGTESCIQVLTITVRKFSLETFMAALVYMDLLHGSVAAAVHVSSLLNLVHT